MHMCEHLSFGIPVYHFKYHVNDGHASETVRPARMNVKERKCLLITMSKTYDVWEQRPLQTRICAGVFCHLLHSLTNNDLK